MFLTVGQLRRLMENLPDDASVVPDWAPGFVPSECDPVVCVEGASIEPGFPIGEPVNQSEDRYLSIHVRVVGLDEVSGENKD